MKIIRLCLIPPDVNKLRMNPQSNETNKNNNNHLRRWRKINAIAACAFSCCRAGNPEMLGKRIDDLIGMGMTVPEIDLLTMTDGQEKTSLLFSALNDTIFKDISYYISLRAENYREIPVPSVSLGMLNSILCRASESALDSVSESALDSVSDPINQDETLSYFWNQGRLYVTFRGEEEMVLTKLETQPIDAKSREGQLECIRLMHRKGFNLMRYNEWGQLLVHRACRPEIMQYFMDQGTSVDVPCVSSDPTMSARTRTALSNAIFWKSEESLAYAWFLMENGADIHLNEPETLSMVNELFAYTFSLTQKSHLDFCKYLVAQGLSLGPLCAWRLIDSIHMSHPHYPSPLEIERLDELLTFLKESLGSDHDLFPNPSIFGYKMSLDLFQCLWKHYALDTYELARTRSEEAIVLCQINHQTDRIDVIIKDERFREASKGVHDAAQEKLAPLGQLAFEKIYVLACLPTVESCVSRKVLEALENQDSQTFTSWFTILIRLQYYEIEKNAVASHIFDLATGDCTTDSKVCLDSKVYLDIVGTIVNCCPKSQDFAVWWSVLPMAVENTHLRTFSNLIGAICAELKEEERNTASKTAKTLRGYVHQYQAKLASKSTKKQRKHHSQKWDPFFKAIKQSIVLA